MKIPFLCFLVVTGWAVSSAGKVGAQASKCEKITIPVCQGLSYNYTMYPNRLNHRTQAEAGLMIHQFFPLVKVDCSSSLALFLCTVYAPKCSDTIIPPCRSLCEHSRRGCQPVMARFGFPWPAILNCSNFPVEGGDEKCIAIDDSNASATTPPTSAARPSTTRSKCEKITIPLCQGLSYNYTMYPNRFGHRTQGKAYLEIFQYSPLVNYGCHKDIRFFLCSLYAPVCTVMETLIPPCRSLCERSKRGCEPFLNEFGIPWPKRFNCSRFPEVGTGALCANHEDTNSHTTAAPTISTTTAVPRSTTNAESKCRKDQFQCKNRRCIPKNWRCDGDNDCGDSSDETICNAYSKCGKDRFQCENRRCIPKTWRCDGTNDCGDSSDEKLCHAESKCGKNKFQCQNTLCIPKIWRCDGMNDCEDSSDEKLCGLPTAIPTTGSPPFTTRRVAAAQASNCEKVTIPLCQGLSYNYTMYPNRLNHRTQAEAGLEIHQFFPLVKVDCSSSLALFLCTIYAPKCSDTIIPPCRSLCEHSRRGCQTMIARFGFTWPANLNCALFPVEGGKTRCIARDHGSASPTISPTTAVPPPTTKFRTVLRNVRGVFTSPNYPNPYPKGSNLNWIIQLPDAYKVVNIKIQKMLLEEDRNCLYDYIIIKDKMLNQVGPRHCGTYRHPHEVLVRGNEATIIFVSDGSTSKAGFIIQYSGLKQDS